MRHALWYQGLGWKDDFAQQKERLVSRMGFAPDLELVRSLYRLDPSVVELPAREDEFGIFRVAVDGVTVRFNEDGFRVRAVVEGTLSEQRLEALQTSVLEKLARLTATPWTLQLPA